MDTDGRGGTTPGTPCSLPNTRHPAKDPSPRLALQIPAQLRSAALQQGARGLTQRPPARGPAEARRTEGCRPTGAGEAANFGPLPLRPVSKQHEVAVTPPSRRPKGAFLREVPPAPRALPPPRTSPPAGTSPRRRPPPPAAGPSASQGRPRPPRWGAATSGAAGGFTRAGRASEWGRRPEEALRGDPGRRERAGARPRRDRGGRRLPTLGSAALSAPPPVAAPHTHPSGSEGGAGLPRREGERRGPRVPRPAEGSGTGPAVALLLGAAGREPAPAPGLRAEQEPPQAPPEQGRGQPAELREFTAARRPGPAGNVCSWSRKS